ncbi:sugar ABC transporter permease [Brevibacillus sp. NRS-1366]|uniref:sugar ABC transporter permease n=1 Tax=Brevibacillus sp. NRS-1366 TaxID=3233899 RepID=UPI003D1B8D17
MSRIVVEDSGSKIENAAHIAKDVVRTPPENFQNELPSNVNVHYRVRILEALAGKWRLLPVFVALLIIWGFFASQNPAFLGARNLSNLAIQIVVTSIIALGLVLLLIIKEIDLSVAATSAVCGAVVAKLSVMYNLNLPLAVITGIGLGVGIGLVQGWVVTKFGAPSFIVTLGVSLALQGVLLQILPQDALISLVGHPVSFVANTYLTDIFSYTILSVIILIVGFMRWQSHVLAKREGLKSVFGSHVVLPTAFISTFGIIILLVLNSYRGFPTALALLTGLLLLFHFVTTQTSFGTYLYGIGGNPEATRRAGIPVNRIRLITFTLAGALSAVGGIVASARVLGVTPESADPTIMLEAIAAAVIGGASLFGGRGSVWAALLGALVIGSISNGLYLMEASTPVRLQIQGAILVIAITVDALIAKDSKARH